MIATIRALIPLTLLTISLALTPFSLSAAIVAAGLSFFSAAIFPIRSVPRGAISLQTVTLGAIAAYSLAVPLHQLAFADYDHDTVRSAFQLCVVAGAGAVCGFLAEYLLRASSPRHSVRFSERTWRMYSLIGWAIFGFGMVSAFAAVSLTVGFHAYWTAGYAGRVLLKREAGPVELGLYHAVVGLLFVALSRMKSRTPTQRISPRRLALFVLLGGICLTFVVYVSFLGIRRPSFFLVVSLMLLYGIAGRGYSKLQLALVAPVLLLFSLFASFRQVLSDAGWGAASLYIRQNFSLAWFDLSKSELGAPYRAIMDVIGSWQGEPLRLGATFLEAIPYALPSALRLPVTSLSQEYTVRNFSAGFIAIGGNMGFSPVAEGYLNYGTVGAFVYFALIAYCMSRLQSKALDRALPFDLIAFAIAGPWFIFWLRTDLASFLKTLLYSIGFPLLLAVALTSLLQQPRLRRRWLAPGYAEAASETR